MQIKPTTGIFIGVTALMGAALACSLPIQQTGPPQTASDSVELGGATSADVEITMGAGELRASGGASDLMEAEFTFNIPDWRPEVNYAVTGDQGRLTVRQPDVEFSGIPDGDVRYEWDLKFKDDVPLDMEVNLGAGETNLDLGSLSLSTLTMRTGAGDVSVVLGGSQLSRGDINAGIGGTTIDLSGDWQNDASLVVRAGVGDLTVVVPSGVGASVEVDMGIGDVNADGFRIQGGAYTNDAFGESDVTIQVDIDGGVGEITLLMSE